MSKNIKKKICSFKLVNIHKPFFFFILLLTWQNTYSKELWTLKRCIESAQKHNKSLQISRNNITLSNQKQKETQTNLIPKITLNADYKYFMELPTQLMPMSALNPQVTEGQFKDIQFGVPHNFNANVQLTMPLYNPQIYSTIENTKIASELAELQYLKTEEQILFDITILYYNAQILRNQIDFIDSNLINSNKLLNNVELLHTQLLATGTDVNKVRLQMEQLNTQRENIFSKYLQVVNILKLNIGISLDKDIIIDAKIVQSETNNTNFENTLDMKIITKQKSLLNNELLSLYRSRFLPSINLIASYSTVGFAYDKSPNEFINFYPNAFAGIQISYPIFDGTASFHKINQKKLEIINNELSSQQINDKTTLEIENIIRQKNIAQNSIINTKNHIDLAKTIYEQTILQQKYGAAALSDILLADNALREAQQNHLNSIIDFLKADLDLKKLTNLIK